MRLILVASLLLCLVVVSLQVAADNADQQTASDLSSPRSRFRLPKLIDFDSFKQMFNKHYTGILENLRRKKLFVARAFKAAISAIGYKHRERSSYLKINSMSDWTDDELNKLNIQSPPEDLGSDLMSKIMQTKSRNDVDITKVTGKSENTIEKSEFGHSQLKVHEMKEEDQQFVDHRTSACLSGPKYQGSCGSCYLFCSLAFFEFLHCKQTNNLVLFSEQFLMDCGAYSGLAGCAGGNPTRVGLFVQNFGLLPADNYQSYMEVEGKCQIGSQMETYKKSWIEVDKLNWIVLEGSELKSALMKSPVMSIMYVTIDFPQYGGGVHFMQNCDKSLGMHWILMVGDGVEDGREYWLFKNSYGTIWGEEGYYKLDKSSDCFVTDQYLVAEMSFKTAQQ